HGAAPGRTSRRAIHSEVPQVSFSPDGRRLITVSWRAAQNWDLRPDVRPAEDLVQLAVLLSGHQIDNSGGYVPGSKEVLVDAWKTLQAKYPEEFTTPAGALASQQRARRAPPQVEE